DSYCVLRIAYCARNEYAIRNTQYVLVYQPVLNQRPNHHKRVLPGDFLAFPELAASVGYGHFVDAVACLEYLGRYLGVEAPAVRLELEVVRNVGGEHLIAGLHV